MSVTKRPSAVLAAGVPPFHPISLSTVMVAVHAVTTLMGSTQGRPPRSPAVMDVLLISVVIINVVGQKSLWYWGNRPGATLAATGAVGAEARAVAVEVERGVTVSATTLDHSTGVLASMEASAPAVGID